MNRYNLVAMLVFVCGAFEISASQYDKQPKRRPIKQTIKQARYEKIKVKCALEPSSKEIKHGLLNK